MFPRQRLWQITVTSHLLTHITSNPITGSFFLFCSLDTHDRFFKETSNHFSLCQPTKALANNNIYFVADPLGWQVVSWVTMAFHVVIEIATTFINFKLGNVLALAFWSILLLTNDAKGTKMIIVLLIWQCVRLGGSMTMDHMWSNFWLWSNNAISQIDHPSLPWANI